MKEGQNYHIRRTELGENNFRLDFSFEEDWKTFLLALSSKLRFIQDVDYNFQYECMGKLGISLEMGFIQVWFEDEKFSDLDAEKIVQEFYLKLVNRFGNEIEFFQT